MAITYYAYHSEEEYWDEVWKASALSRLLAVAQRDPLTAHLLTNLPNQGPILEGGCGLGQYVVYLRAQGYSIIGADFSAAALQTHKLAYPGSPLLHLDLQRMPFADDAWQGHISIGVVEHSQEGPYKMLREFYRTLAPGGTLLLSIPWVNGYRRFARPLIQRRQNRLRAAGADFYQYAFTRAEVRAFLKNAGFRVQAFYPYSPAKGMREFPLFRYLYHRPGAHPAQRETVAPLSARVGAENVQGMRRFLYWPPVLWTFAHMILAVAYKPES